MYWAQLSFTPRQLTHIVEACRSILLVVISMSAVFVLEATEERVECMGKNGLTTSPLNKLYTNVPPPPPPFPHIHTEYTP